MNNIGQRFKSARLRVGLSGRELARRVAAKGVNFSQQSYHAIEAGAVKRPRFADLVAEVINDEAQAKGIDLVVTPGWLVFGEGVMTDPLVEDLPPPERKLPLVAMDDMGKLASKGRLESVDLNRRAKRMLTMDGDGRMVYVEIVGSTMDRAAWPSFPDGSMVLIELGARAKSGDFVLALIDGGAVFRRMIREGSQIHLEALNPQYPPLTLPAPVEIIGVAREVRMQL